MTHKIAFIGLGNMGGGMAANQAKAGHAVAAFDLSAAALERAVAARATVNAWCNLTGTAPPAAVANPLPEQLTMIQVCMPPCVAASLLVPSPNAGVRCPSKPRPMQVRYLESQVEEMRPDVLKQLRLASGRHQVSDLVLFC